jgi:hypothetical protein
MAAAIAQIAGAAISAYGTIAGGKAAREMGEIEKAQYYEKALKVEAVAQREAIAERDKAGLYKSRAKAVTAASGFASDDPGATRIQQDLEAQGEYNAMAALYSGYQQSKDLRNQGNVAEADGNNAYKASKVSALTNLLQTGGSMYGSYGGGGPSGSAGSGGR